MANKPKRIIIDTNLWISFLITKDFRKIDKQIADRQVILLFSEELLEEFIEVTHRPKFRKFFKSNNVELLITLLNDFAEFIIVKSDVKKCRDEKDNFLLNLAVDGKADFLISGDNDLLELKTIRKTKIITIQDYLKL